MNSPLRDKVALVTGAGTRVGKAIALELGRRGMRVVVHYKTSRAGAEQTCQELEALGTTGFPERADLAARSQARDLVRRSVDHCGRLDLLVSSAASFERIAFGNLDDDAWDRSLALNTSATFAMAHEAAPVLTAARGSMVFITCSSTITPMRNYLPYVVSKAALLQLARVLALELAPNVRVNAVAPGTVLPPESMTEAELKRLRSRIPLERFGSAKQIAAAATFLAESDFTTGQQIVIDGGRSLAAVETFG